MIPALWETRRLRARNVVMTDTDGLLALFNANSDVGEWDPTFHVIPREEMEGLVVASIEGKELHGRPFQMQCFEERASGRLLGYYHCTYGMPQPGTIWIGIFAMAANVRGMGYGREAVDVLNSLWSMEWSYDRAWAEVWLKNWPALRFWIAAGFSRIVEWRGDGVLTAHSQASVLLERRLHRVEST